MKILNLDDYAKITRTVTVNGVTYEIAEMSVADFIETTKDAESLEKSTRFSDQIELTVKVAARTIPSMPEEVIRSLRVDQLVVLSKFLRNELVEIKEGAAQEGEEPGKE